jgi:hypothetical protein
MPICHQSVPFGRLPLHKVIFMSELEVKNLAELKKELEERILKQEKELTYLRTSLKLVDEALASTSFKPASKLVEKPVAELSPAFAEARTRVEPKTPEPFLQKAAPVQPPQPIQEEQSFPIKSKMGEDLATMYVGQSSVRIVPRHDLGFSAKTPPFQSFFVDRVMGEMRRKDEMAVDSGAKDPSLMIDHEVKLDGDSIKEIVIRNIDEEARLREIRSSIRWTLERMLEKFQRV